MLRYGRATTATASSITMNENRGSRHDLRGDAISWAVMRGCLTRAAVSRTSLRRSHPHL